MHSFLAPSYKTAALALILCLCFVSGCSSPARKPNLELNKNTTREERGIGVNSTEALVKALKNGSPVVRGAAACELGKIGDKKAVDGLIEALRDENPFVRQEAASALGAIGDKKAVEALTAALDDSSSGVQAAAVEALVKITGEDLSKIRGKNPGS